MIISIWNKALKGDVQAFNSIRDSVGEKPRDVIDNINNEQRVVIVNDLGVDTNEDKS